MNQVLLLAIVLAAAYMDLGMAQEENCDTEKWLPEGEGTSHEGCVEYDGSLVPDCGEFIHNEVTSYYHVHEYSKHQELANINFIKISMTTELQHSKQLSYKLKKERKFRCTLFPIYKQYVPLEKGVSQALLV